MQSAKESDDSTRLSQASERVRACQMLQHTHYSRFFPFPSHPFSFASVRIDHGPVRSHAAFHGDRPHGGGSGGRPAPRRPSRTLSTVDGGSVDLLSCGVLGTWACPQSHWPRLRGFRSLEALAACRYNACCHALTGDPLQSEDEWVRPPATPSHSVTTP